MTRYELTEKAMQPERIWHGFYEFAERTRMTGAPDTHMVMVANEYKQLEPAEAMWSIGEYVGVYTVPAALELNAAWSLERFKSEGKEIEPWLVENFKGLSMRRERRATRTPTKLTRYLNSWHDWIYDSGLFLARADITPIERYVLMWDSIMQTVWGAGRYGTLKLLETMHRAGTAKLETPDIRPIDATTPRKMLNMLYPGSPATGNKPEEIALVNGYALQISTGLREHGLPWDMYHTEVFLCEFLQAMKGGQYPGLSIDSEVNHYNKVYAHFPKGAASVRFWELRKELFPEWTLGELNGWEGTRDELRRCFPEFDYTWSDSLYDFHAMKDPSEPVVKEEPVAASMVRETESDLFAANYAV